MSKILIKKAGSNTMYDVDVKTHKKQHMQDLHNFLYIKILLYHSISF